MPKKFDATFADFKNPGQGAGRSIANKALGARDARSVHASALIQRVNDIKNIVQAAGKRLLSAGEVEKAGELAGQYGRAQYVLQNYTKAGAGSDTAKFTREGALGTINPKIRAATGNPGGSFDEVAGQMAEQFAKLKKGPIGEKLRDSAAALKTAAAANEPAAVSALKSAAFGALKHFGLAALVGAVLPVPTIEAAKKEMQKREDEAVAGKGA